MTRADKIYLRWGLRAKARWWAGVLDRVMSVAYALIAVVALYGVFTTATELAQDMVQEKVAQAVAPVEAERLKYELVIVECLNDRSIKINGEYRGC